MSREQYSKFRNRRIARLSKHGWIPLKQWAIEESERNGLSVGSSYMRVYRGLISLKRIALTSRTILVKP